MSHVQVNVVDKNLRGGDAVTASISLKKRG
jgi:hypothetical protein